MSPWGSGLISRSCFSPDVTGSSGIRVLPQGYGWNLLYGSLLLSLVGVVCTLGAGLYARASFLTFLLVSGSLASVLISFVAVGPRDIRLAPRPGSNASSVPPRYGHFTGFNSSTLKDNLGGELNTVVGGRQGVCVSRRWAVESPEEGLERWLGVPSTHIWQFTAPASRNMAPFSSLLGRLHTHGITPPPHL